MRNIYTLFGHKISRCSYQTVTKWEIHKAEKMSNNSIVPLDAIKVTSVNSLTGKAMEAFLATNHRRQTSAKARVCTMYDNIVRLLNLKPQYRRCLIVTDNIRKLSSYLSQSFRQILAFWLAKKVIIDNALHWTRRSEVHQGSLWREGSVAKRREEKHRSVLVLNKPTFLGLLNTYR